MAEHERVEPLLVGGGPATGKYLRLHPAWFVGDGRLHDTRGVWIGDASALPTAPGVNPMIAIMALAERTASRILALEMDPVSA